MVMVVATMARRHKTTPADTLGILSFDAGKTMCRLISLYNSLSDEEITKLRHEVIKSKGVTYLNSQHECFLLNLAAAERLEELDLIAATVSHLGRKCSDVDLARFELIYANLKLGMVDIQKLEYGTRKAQKIIEKMEKFITTTASLHTAMESLQQLENADKRRQQRCKTTMTGSTNTNNIIKPNMDYFNEKLVSARKQVQHYKETSLWQQKFDKIVAIMVRLIYIIYTRLCSIFGSYVTACDNNKHNNDNNIVSSLDHCCILEYRQLYQTNCRIYDQESLQTKSVTKSGPNSKVTKTGVIRFLHNTLVAMDSAYGEIEKMKRNNNKVLKLASPSTVGGAGLAVRYANVILSAERCLHEPATVGKDEREALYEMLPARLRVKVRAKLWGRWMKEEEEGGDGQSLAEGWRDAVEELMEWLSPVAHDTMRWQAERHLEKTRFETKPKVLLLQTLHYSDLEKAEAAIVEVLVGLSCIYWCERKCSYNKGI